MIIYDYELNSSEIDDLYNLNHGLIEGYGFEDSNQYAEEDSNISNLANVISILKKLFGL